MISKPSSRVPPLSVQMPNAPPTRLLIINPNSTESITKGLEASLTPLAPPNTSLTFVTGPPGCPAGISDRTTGIESAWKCWEMLKEMDAVEKFDAFLVCCFSDHPLAHILREQTTKPTLHILEVSVTHALLTSTRFSIITTGPIDAPQPHLDAAVHTFLGSSSSSRYASLRTTGLGVVELKEGDPLRVKEGVMRCARRVAKEDGCDAVILGCAGMAGMEDVVREGAGNSGLKVVDGAKAGVVLLPALVALSRAS